MHIIVLTNHAFMSLLNCVKGLKCGGSYLIREVRHNLDTARVVNGSNIFRQILVLFHFENEGVFVIILVPNVYTIPLPNLKVILSLRSCTQNMFL